jgi:integrase
VSIERRPDANRETWRVRWREGGKARGRNFRTYDAAVAFEADRLRRRELGAFAPVLATADTLADWLDRWQDRYGPGWSETTRRQRRWILTKHVVAHVGHVPLREFGPARVREYRDHLASQASASTVNAVMAVLSAALGRAVDEGLVPGNPAAGIRSLPAFRTRPRALTVREVEDIRKAMTCPRDRLIVSLLAYAGLRPAEVVGLVWENVTAASIIVDRSAQFGQVVPTKTRRIRAVPIEQPLGDDFEHVPRGQRRGIVVPGVRGGLLVWRNFVRREWRRACEQAQVTAVPYDLRHTYATLMLYSRPVHAVSAALGHASASMTLDTYAHVLEDVRLTGPVDLMAEAIAERRRRDAPSTPDLHGPDGPGAYVPAHGDRMHAEPGSGLVDG